MVYDGCVSAVVIVEVFASRSDGAEGSELVASAAYLVRSLRSCMTANDEKQRGQNSDDRVGGSKHVERERMGLNVVFDGF